jgi:hypothetical protein
MKTPPLIKCKPCGNKLSRCTQGMYDIPDNLSPKFVTSLHILHGMSELQTY